MFKYKRNEKVSSYTGYILPLYESEFSMPNTFQNDSLIIQV